MMRNNRVIVVIPVIVALALIIGVFIGRKMTSASADYILNSGSSSQSHKLNQVINYIRSDYVDTVKENWIVEKTINGILEQLDPHSAYIPGSKYHAYNDPLEGNFEGIGIEFRIQEDTIVVAKPVSGGPSEKIGLLAGDRIVTVDGKDITGSTLNNHKVMKLLKGPKGSTVSIGIKRKAIKKLIDFEIERDEIPIYSVESAYMVNKDIGYIKIIRFAKTTHQEFLDAAGNMKAQGMKKLIVDLRGNSGGFMQAATNLADEFLKAEHLIVYTQGKARQRQDVVSTSKGEFEETELLVLIDEGSASASEIFAGAIQDQDRGIIAGRRSFGKGLVQEPMEWSDGSQIRLTVARYYTPSGRSIQKPYGATIDNYDDEYYKRYESGELFFADSIPYNDSLVYKTRGGRVVYGGGGISPDFFIPMDTSGGSSFFSTLNYMGIFYQFGFDYVDQKRDELKTSYSDKDFIQAFKINEVLKEQFFQFAEKKGVEFDEKGAHESEYLIENTLKATIARNLFGDNLFYQVLNQRDKAVKESVNYLKTKNPA